MIYTRCVTSLCSSPVLRSMLRPQKKKKKLCVCVGSAGDCDGQLPHKRPVFSGSFQEA